MSSSNSQSTSRSSSRPQSLRHRTSGQFDLDTAQLHNLLNRRSSPSNSTERSSDDNSSVRSMSIVSMSNVHASLPQSPPNPLPAGHRGVIVAVTNLQPHSPTPPPNGLRNIVVTNGQERLSQTGPIGHRTVMVGKSTARRSDEREEPSPLLRIDEENRVVPLVHRQLYVDEIVWKIDDHVFVSAIDASMNMSLLCRLNIGFICEIYDHTAYEAKPAKSLLCQCMCQQQFRHHRSIASIDVPDSEQKCISKSCKIQNLFAEFVEMAEKERSKDKCVLVCSTRGRNRAPAFASAYLMSKWLVPRGKAVAEVSKKMKTMRPPVNISDYMQRALMRYQGQLGVIPEPENVSTIGINGKQRSSAWTY